VAEVYVDGIKQVRKALNGVEERTAKEVNQALRDKVAEPVAARVRQRVPRSTITRRGGRKKQHWADKIKAGGNASGAYITWGRKSVPWAPWVEFGGTIEQPNRGVEITRQRSAEGRYVYPEVQDSAGSAGRATERVINDLIRSSGLT